MIRRFNSAMASCLVFVCLMMSAMTPVRAENVVSVGGAGYDAVNHYGYVNCIWVYENQFNCRTDITMSVSVQYYNSSNQYLGHYGYINVDGIKNRYGASGDSDVTFSFDIAGASAYAPSGTAYWKYICYFLAKGYAGLPQTLIAEDDTTSIEYTYTP